MSESVPRCPSLKISKNAIGRKKTHIFDALKNRSSSQHLYIYGCVHVAKLNVHQQRSYTGVQLCLFLCFQLLL